MHVEIGSSSMTDELDVAECCVAKVYCEYQIIHSFGSKAPWRTGDYGYGTIQPNIESFAVPEHSMHIPRAAIEMLPSDQDT